jgi:hypothetical protein
MTEALDFNRIAAIAATLQDLSKDRSAPIVIEGDVVVERPDGSGIDFLDMDEGEACRRVVEKVIEHPYFQEMLAERDQLWEALKWLTLNVEAVPLPPNEHQAVIESAIDACGWDEDHTTLS